MRRPPNRIAVLAGSLLLAACSSGAARNGEPEPDRAPLALFTTLPIYWGGDGEIATILDDSDGEPGWVRSVLEEDARLVPLDNLEEGALGGISHLVMAQPRPLAPSENVALDDWVRAGGRLLMFADPMLTEHSEFGIGDPRRPHDTVVLSPILARWGLELQFDDTQDLGETLRATPYGAVPVNLAGRFVSSDGGVDAQCTLGESALVANCRVGQGRVILLADAALLETERDSAARRGILRDLLRALAAD